jgi:hypothetical protein
MLLLSSEDPEGCEPPAILKLEGRRLEIDKPELKERGGCIRRSKEIGGSLRELSTLDSVTGATG